MVIKSVAPGKSFNLKNRLCGGGIRFRTTKTVGPVIGSSGAIAVNPHETNTLVTFFGRILRSVNRDKMVIEPQSMDMSVMTRKNPLPEAFCQVKLQRREPPCPDRTPPAQPRQNNSMDYNSITNLPIFIGGASVCMKSETLRGSLMKKTGVLLPTRS